MSGDSDLRPSHEGEEPRDEFAEAVDRSYGSSPVKSDDKDDTSRKYQTRKAFDYIQTTRKAFDYYNIDLHFDK